ncbi:MAG: VPLPA-CTERM sorting domain-containing protein [Nitrospira sp.]|nr:MAG: VPLPA-CTERM sorting domain-containing protein [Nitrospira sp.]
MTKRTVLLAVAALGLWLAAAAPSHAATVTAPGPATGLTYEWQVVMGDLDLAHYHGAVGAKSWAEPGNPVGAKGWTHTSDWTALDLTGLSGPTFLTLELGRAEGGVSQLFPAFSLYAGWETVNSDATNHTWNNTGAISWATNLTYIDHLSNAGGPNGTASGALLDPVSKSWVLAPGLYTLNYGGNPSFALGQIGNHDFAATLTTSPVPVPAAVWLFGSGIAALVGIARRRMTV